ncbi:uncharacterized protein F5147DRAFT_650361 [Suillus discolor]|uniref:Uncharacterized protein n=1 Tax=Suillus discolor TaxID=1912936 RepID=A0A9P7FBJ1_9AGAM|nr:uncharacterized protein F5147DRAFT_650361 [Suillus discolor]KAG2113419.1 hypothetical protein F5147DRAFT_650361 [Suillus discolor]
MSRFPPVILGSSSVRIWGSMLIMVYMRRAASGDQVQGSLGHSEVIVVPDRCLLRFKQHAAASCTMVRPLIYNTPEEKKNAARVYRRMYYERKKEEISVKMAAKYQAKKMASQIMDSGRHMQTLPKLSCLTNIHVMKLSHPVICDVDDTEASLLTCSIFNTLYAQMIQGPGDQQIVLAMLSVRLEVLESIQEYVRLCHRGKSHFSAAIMEHLSNLFYQCKLVTAATEELWCYAAISEIDVEMLTKFSQGSLLFQYL